MTRILIPGTTRPPKPPTAAERWYGLGAELARAGRYTEALEPLEQALAYSIEMPDVHFARRLRSFYGLALAMGRGDVSRGRRLCEESVADGTRDLDLYINLARVYLRASRKDLAIEAIGVAQVLDPSNDAVHDIARQLGQRRPPVFTFLHRSHPVNRFAGRLRYQWQQRAR